MAQLDVHLVTPRGVVWEGQASAVTFMAADGEIGILPGHSPVLAVLGEGDIRIKTQDSNVWSAFLSGGFVSVDEDVIAVVADDVTMTEPAPTGRG